MEEREVEQLAIHLQQARAYARYLPGGENHGSLVEEHVLSPDQAAAAVVEELDAALELLGAEA
ncbi:hypothetical protein [Stenotrophomonas maltophilia]|uniref:hypothetical protein n=1 Tax=Stenotrophomonas maltophilia TaxID=40324 RepID=UPI000B4CFDAD|nr:hypothetical protein [Stenotrophomonas maltophilia]OWQ68446.1 hypothetical protein CEE58_01100 [Stenotrophomonas maltophilia]